MGALLRYLIVRLFDFFAPLKGPVNDSGGIFVVRDFLPAAQVERYLARLGTRERMRLSRRDVVEIAGSSLVRRAVRQYLGAFCTLDHAMIWVAPATSTAGEWHHDSVGHRLKLFILLRSESAHVGTCVAPFTHRTRHRSYDSERAAPPDTEVAPLRLAAGDMFIFDTNSLHRGNYGGAGRDRIVLQLEFSNFFKGLLTPGKIGVLRRHTDLSV